MDGLPTRYIALGVNTDYTHDGFNRRQETTVDLERDIVTDYNYTTYTKNNVTYYTNQLLSEKIDGTLYKYTYDEVGNITAIAKGGVTYRTYTYDALNQLLSETNHIDGTRTEYEYNHLGNIRFKKNYSTEDNKLQKQTEYKYYTDTDTGWWLDLTEIETIEYNSDGEATKTTKEKVNYDTIGNPTTYRDATMSWYGRQLTKYKIDKDTEDDTSDDVTFDFTYDADGLRGSKVKEYYVKNEDGNYVAKSEKTIYQYVGDKLYYEKRGDYQEFYYFYDSYGKLSAIYYNFKSPTTGKSSSAVYFVTTNSQGDVIGLYNNKGVKVAAYEYDAWGNILSVIDADGEPIDEWYHIANANPIRYRGYYYDDDLKLYYLQSRYYDSTVGRFINADTADVLSASPYDVTDKNLYAYCDNNPITRADDGGECWVLVGAAVGAVIGGAVSAISQYATTGGINWSVVAVNFLSGAISGGLASTGIGLIASTGINATLGGATYVAEQVVKGEDVEVGGVLASTFAGGLGGAIGGKGANAKSLSLLWKNASKGIERELRRVNVKYATKQISKYVAEKVAVKNSVIISIGRAAMGTISNAFSRWKMGY